MTETWQWLWISVEVDLARKTNAWDFAVAMDIDGLLYAPIRCDGSDGWL